MKVRIKTFNGGLPEYLTEGKEYEVVCGNGRYLDIVGDNEMPVLLDINDCDHLNGGSWEVINENKILLVGCSEKHNMDCN